MSTDESDVEWAVEKVTVDGEDQIVLTVADDDDAVAYIMDPFEAALLAAAIFDAIEKESDT